MTELITLDLDGTLLPHDTAFAAVLRHNGRADDVADSDRRFFAGEISLEDCFWQQWAWVQELSLASMHRALRQASWMPDIADAVRDWKAEGARVCMLTDQPSVLCDYLGRWGLTDPICSPVTVREGRCVDIDARFDKWANLEARLDRWHIDPDAVVHVGNGSNDVPVWNHVGHGIAMFAEPEVAAAADVDLGQPTSLKAVGSLGK